MPELAPLSGAEVKRTRERLGFSAVRPSGRQVILRRGQQRWVVPMHQEIQVGTLAGILRQAGATSADFIDAI